MITINNLSKKWGNDANTSHIFKDFSLHIEKGDFVGIVGPNGVGKTTLFNVIAGLDRNYKGSVLIGEKSISCSKDIGYVFQNYRQSLFPWLSVVENISYPLALKGTTTTEQRNRVIALFKEYSVNIELDKYPYELSGGQQQLVALLRALIHEPKILLLDEPFSAIDHDSTILLMSILQKVWMSKKVTILLISHDMDEALLMSKKIVVLGKCPVVVVGECSYDEFYPRTTQVMGTERFISAKRNILDLFSSKTLK